MNQKSKVSIIIPCFNAENHLHTLIEALSNQTGLPDEIIIVDDGSKDNTKQVALSISKRNKSIKVVSQNNSGPAKARNVGAKIAKGDIIIFTDSDCVPDKLWVDEMTRPFKDKEVSGVQGAYKTKQKEIIARFGQIEIEERYKKMDESKDLDWVGSYSGAFRRNEFLKLNGYDETFPIASGEDPEFSFRLAKNGGKLIFNPKAVVYHTHPNNLFKYLKTKFFRAYFRPKMYAKHKSKIIKDSYTPQLLKLQIPLSGAIILSTVSTPLLGPLPLFVLIIIFLLTTLPFTFFALRKDPLIGLISPGMVFLRSVVFGAGLFSGIINRGRK